MQGASTSTPRKRRSRTASPFLRLHTVERSETINHPLCVHVHGWFVTYNQTSPLTIHIAAPLRKRSRSVFLLGCKRPHDEKPSLPTFCGYCAPAARIHKGTSSVTFGAVSHFAYHSAALRYIGNSRDNAMRCLPRTMLRYSGAVARFPRVAISSPCCTQGKALITHQWLMQRAGCIALLA